jgi:hypothetical protein
MTLDAILRKSSHRFSDKELRELAFDEILGQPIDIYAYFRDIYEHNSVYRSGEVTNLECPRRKTL